MAVPMFSEYMVDVSVDSTANQMVAELASARAKAISRRNNFIVTFYSTSGAAHRYEIHDDVNNNGTRDGGEEVKSITLPEGIRFGANSVNGVDNLSINSSGLNLGSDNKVSFNGRGYASTTGAVYLIPAADLSPGPRNDRMRAVRILQATGSVTRWRYSAEAASPGPWE